MSRNYRAIVDRIAGPLVPILPAFNSNQQLDFDATCRWVSWLVSAGMPMFWLTPGTSRYLCMSDQEVFDLTRAVAGVTRDKSIFVACTNHHWPVHVCRRYIEECARWGADIVKVVPHQNGAGNEDVCFSFYRAVAEDSPLPLFAYSLMPMMTPALLRRILDLPQYVGMKNDSGDFYEHRDYLWTIAQQRAKFTAMTGGSLMSFLWGFDFGATAFAAGLGIVAPHLAIAFHRHLVDGNRHQAVRIVREVEEPLVAALAPLGGWWSLRAALVKVGLFPSLQERYPFRSLAKPEADVVVSTLEGLGYMPNIR